MNRGIGLRTIFRQRVCESELLPFDLWNSANARNNRSNGVRFDQFLSSEDVAQTRAVLKKLTRHGFRGFALTGGLAVESQLVYHGRSVRSRRFNDIDLIVETFESIPKSIAADFAVQPISASDADDQSIVQLIDRDHAVRIDVFEQPKAVLARAPEILLEEDGALKVDSVEDLASRAASLAMSLERGLRVPIKHVHDYQRLLDLVDPNSIEVAWQHHRTSRDPTEFRFACVRIPRLLATRRNLLVDSDCDGLAPPVCSFCQRSSDDIRKMAGGPHGARICDDCIRLGRVALIEETPQANPFVRMEPVPPEGTERCSFCGRLSNGRRLFRSKNCLMCSQCLEISEVMVEKGVVTPRRKIRFQAVRNLLGV
jgi:ClpX C4-type zinc finger protein